VEDFGARERLGEKDDVRVQAPQLGDAPLPEGKGLGVRVVDAKDADALAGPVEKDRQELVPELTPVLGLEVEGVDVLVLLGWVLGVLDAAVPSVLAPLGMLA